MKRQKPLSPAHKRLRRGLYVLLGISVIFALGMSLTYFAFRERWVPRDEILPYVFQIDIAQHKARTFFTGQEGDFDIASEMLRLAVVAPEYRATGKDMMKDLADDGYPPAQVAHANIIKFRFPLDENHAKAREYLRAAADQGYEPAIEQLQE